MTSATGHTASGASHGETGHECDAECMDNSRGVPCTCPEGFFGSLTCQEQTGSFNSYCKWERRQEERAAREFLSDEDESRA